jgi:hypothetical protein
MNDSAYRVPGSVAKHGPLKNFSSPRRNVKFGFVSVVDSYSKKRSLGIELLMNDPLIIVKRTVDPPGRFSGKPFCNFSSGIARD